MEKSPRKLPKFGHGRRCSVLLVISFVLEGFSEIKGCCQGKSDVRLPIRNYADLITCVPSRWFPTIRNHVVRMISNSLKNPVGAIRRR